MASNSNGSRDESSFATSRVLIKDTDTGRSVVVTLYGKFRGEMYVSAITECPKTYGNIPRFIYLIGNGNRIVIPDTRLEVEVDELMSCRFNGYASSSNVSHAKYRRGTPHECEDEVKLVMELSKHFRTGSKDTGASRFFTVTRGRESNDGSSPRDRRPARDRHDMQPTGNNDSYKRNDKMKKKGVTMKEKNSNSDSGSSVTPLPIGVPHDTDFGTNDSVDGAGASDSSLLTLPSTVDEKNARRTPHPPRRGSEGNTSKVSDDSIDPTDSISNVDTRGSEPGVSRSNGEVDNKNDSLTRLTGATPKTRTPYDELNRRAEEGAHTTSSLAGSDLTSKHTRNKPVPASMSLDSFTTEFSDWRSYFTSSTFYRDGKREEIWDIHVVPNDWIALNKGDKVNVAVYAQSAVKPKAFYSVTVYGHM